MRKRQKEKWEENIKKLPAATMEEEAIFKIIEPLDMRQRAFTLMLWKGSTKEAAGRFAGYVNGKTKQFGNCSLVAKRLKPILDQLTKLEIYSKSMDKEYLIKNLIEDIERGRSPTQEDKFGVAKIFTRSKGIEMGMKHLGILGEEKEEVRVPQTLVIKVDTGEK